MNKFSSISYLDREAGNKPNLEWYYKVRTKMASASSSDLVSTTHYFKRLGSVHSRALSPLGLEERL